MINVYRVKFSGCFTNEGFIYLKGAEYLVSDRIFARIPPDVIESQTSIKLPFNKREQLGFSANSSIGAAIVDGLYVFADKTPGRQDLIDWCIINNLRGQILANLIHKIYGDVNKSYFFWADMIEIVFKYISIDLEELEEKLQARETKRGSILTRTVDV